MQDKTQTTTSVTSKNTIKDATKSTNNQVQANAEVASGTADAKHGDAKSKTDEPSDKKKVGEKDKDKGVKGQGAGGVGAGSGAEEETKSGSKSETVAMSIVLALVSPVALIAYLIYKIKQGFGSKKKKNTGHSLNAGGNAGAQVGDFAKVWNALKESVGKAMGQTKQPEPKQDEQKIENKQQQAGQAKGGEQMKQPDTQIVTQVSSEKKQDKKEQDSHEKDGTDKGNKPNEVKAEQQQTPKTQVQPQVQPQTRSNETKLEQIMNNEKLGGLDKITATDSKDVVKVQSPVGVSKGENGLRV